MDTNDAYRLARSLMNQHGLQDWKLKYDGGKRRAGYCSYSNRTISFSRHITQLESEGFMRNIILHEIAHALTPGQHHNSVWQRKAIEIGCDGKRCHSGSTAEYNYIVRCPNGHERGAYRRSSKRKSCGRCSRQFDPRFLLTYYPA